MVQFLSINFFSWISSIFVGVFKSFRFFVSPCTRQVNSSEKMGLPYNPQKFNYVLYSYFS